MLELRHGQPRLLYGLARVEARAGNRAAALAWLRAYADLGLIANLKADKDLAGLDGSEIEARMAESRKPVACGEAVATLPDANLLVEDVVWDPGTRTFYFSSIKQKKILALDAQGRFRDFATGAPWGVMGLALDARRRLLWATSADIEGEKSAVLKYALDSGKLLQQFELDGKHLFGDAALGPRGELYLGDSKGAFYHIPAGGKSVELLVREGLLGPQTPAVSGDGKTVFWADYLLGIAVFDVKSGHFSLLKHPKNVTLHGIDGLYLTGDTLYAVQNGTLPNRIVRLTLDKAHREVVDAKVLEANTERLGAPNHGVVVGGDFYFIANSGWDLPDGKQPTPAQLIRCKN